METPTTTKSAIRRASRRIEWLERALARPRSAARTAELVASLRVQRQLLASHRATKLGV